MVFSINDMVHLEDVQLKKNESRPISHNIHTISSNHRPNCEIWNNKFSRVNLGERISVCYFNRLRFLKRSRKNHESDNDNPYD